MSQLMASSLAAQGKAADSGDGGNGERLQTAEHVVALAAELAALGLAQAIHLTDVGPGDKGFFTFAPDDNAADLFQIQIAEHRVQLADDLVVECIEGLGTGDGDDSHRPFCGVLYKFHLKASLSQVGHQAQVPCA